MADRWLGTTVEEAALVVFSAVAIYLAVLSYTRIAGLRSFAKMSSFDFAMTVAIGSIMATVATGPSATLANGLVALAVLYVLQVLIGFARRRRKLAHAIDNRPLLLLHDGRPIPEALAHVRMTSDDLQAKLRASGVASLSGAAAVVLETTGDVSVIEAPADLDPDLFSDVRGAERLR